MKRRNALVLFTVFAGCGASRKPLSDILPQELAGGWKRGDVSTLTDIPEVIAKLGPDESARTTYSGPATVELRAFRMKAETSAFELIQKWRQSEGLAAYKGRYFFVAAGDRATEVLRALQAAITP